MQAAAAASGQNVGLSSSGPAQQARGFAVGAPHTLAVTAADFHGEIGNNCAKACSSDTLLSSPSTLFLERGVEELSYEGFALCKHTYNHWFLSRRWRWGRGWVLFKAATLTSHSQQAA